MAKAKAEPHLGSKVCVVMIYPDGHTRTRQLEWNDSLQRYIFTKTECDKDAKVVRSTRFAAMKYKGAIERLAAVGLMAF